MTRGAETNRMMLGPEKHTIKIVVDEKTGETHVVGLFDEEFKKKMALKAQINTFGFSPDVSSPDEYIELIRPGFNFWFGPAEEKPTVNSNDKPRENKKKQLKKRKRFN